MEEKVTKSNTALIIVVETIIFGTFKARNQCEIDYTVGVQAVSDI